MCAILHVSAHITTQVYTGGIIVLELTTTMSQSLSLEVWLILFILLSQTICFEGEGNRTGCVSNHQVLEWRST